jgi:hypothetical protein
MIAKYSTGLAGAPLGDLFLLDPGALAWRAVADVGGAFPMARHSHCFAAAVGGLFMFGGRDARGGE